MNMVILQLWYEEIHTQQMWLGASCEALPRSTEAVHNGHVESLTVSENGDQTSLLKSDRQPSLDCTLRRCLSGQQKYKV